MDLEKAIKWKTDLRQARSKSKGEKPNLFKCKQEHKQAKYKTSFGTKFPALIGQLLFSETMYSNPIAGM